MKKPDLVQWINPDLACKMVTEALGYFPPANSQAERTLLGALRDGDVRARRFSRKQDRELSKFPVELASEYWVSKTEIDPGDNGAVEINHVDLTSWLGGRTESSGRRPGREAKYDWRQMWIEIVAIANRPDGLPQQPELILDLQTWFEQQRGSAPDPSQIRKELAGLYDRLAQK